MPSASASTTTCRRSCRCRSAPARPRVLRMVTAYSMLANGGKRIKPTLIDRIQDRWGHTIYRHDERVCEGCDARQVGRPGRAEADRQARAGARSADRLSDHLDHGRRDHARHRAGHQGARPPSRRQDRHHQRRQGRVVRRLFARSRGRASISATTSRARSATTAYAAQYAAPVFRDFMRMALKDKPDVPFRVPPGIKLISVDLHSGHAQHAARARSSRPSSPARRRPTATLSATPRRASSTGRRGGPGRGVGNGRPVLRRLPQCGTSDRRPRGMPNVALIPLCFSRKVCQDYVAAYCVGLLS